MRYGAICAAVMLAGSVGAASAQQEPPAPPQGGATPEAATPAPDGPARDMPMGHPPVGMGMEGHEAMAMEHHGRRRHAQAGFKIRMGEGRSLRVRCGDEPIRACIDAATSVIDRIAAAGGGGERPTGP